MLINRIEVFSELFLVTFLALSQIVIFNKAGRVILKADLTGLEIDVGHHIMSINFAIFPRLEWSDRYFDIF